MAAQKPLTKGQIIAHFAEKFDLSKKTALSIIDEMAALVFSAIFVVILEQIRRRSLCLCF
jgi:nucleoid DNA-binding protein